MSIEAPADVLTLEQFRRLRGVLLSFVREYKGNQVHTPTLIDDTWQNIWEAIGKSVGHQYQVSSCDRTTKELAQLRREDRTVLLLPDDIYTQEGLMRLGRVFRLMRSWITKPEGVVEILNGSMQGGCIDIEISPDAPYRSPRGYNQDEITQQIEGDKRFGQRLPTYLVASQFSYLLTGQNFDQNTWSLLPGSSWRNTKRGLGANFDSNGRVFVSDWNPQGRHPRLGGRSEGRI